LLKPEDVGAYRDGVAGHRSCFVGRSEDLHDVGLLTDAGR